MRRRLLFIGLVLGLLTLLPASASATNVYVANGTNNLMSGFSIGSGGSLTPIACSGASCSSAGFLEALTITPDNKFLYGADPDHNVVDEFSIGSGGALSNLCGSSCPATGNTPIGAATSPNGKFVFVANQNQASIAPFSVGSGGALTPITCTTGCQSQSGSPDGLAITPNGKFMYAADQDESVDAWSIGSSGALTQICTSSTCPGATGDPIPAVVTPDGKYLYIGDRDQGNIYAFQIGSDGALTAIPCTACLGGSGLADLAITPNGKYLYAANEGADSLSAFTINSDGTLTPISCSACTAGSNSYVSVAVEPGSRYVYALINSSNNSITVAPFSIGADGSLTAISCSPSVCTFNGNGIDVFGLVISPDQAPVAKFTHGTARAGSTTSFNGSGSTAYQTATVARYDWSFGDGKKALNAGPKPKHKYAKPGHYKVTLTVTDSLGCSTQQVFTGQTMSCNGSSVARITHTVHVTAAKKATLSLRNLPSGCVRSSTTIGVKVSTAAGSGPHKTSVSVNGHRVAQSKKLGFSATIALGRLRVGSNTVSAVSVDRFGRHSRTSANIKRCSTSAAFTG